MYELPNMEGVNSLCFLVPGQRYILRIKVKDMNVAVFIL
jgi:hypothetical protein